MFRYLNIWIFEYLKNIYLTKKMHSLDFLSGDVCHESLEVEMFASSFIRIFSRLRMSSTAISGPGFSADSAAAVSWAFVSSLGAFSRLSTALSLSSFKLSSVIDWTSMTFALVVDITSLMSPWPWLLEPVCAGSSSFLLWWWCFLWWWWLFLCSWCCCFSSFSLFCLDSSSRSRAFSSSSWENC